MTGTDWLGLDGKTVLVTGRKNRKSVAWHVAKQLEEVGARVAFSIAFLQGRAAAATHPRSKAAAEISALADAVAERLPIS